MANTMLNLCSDGLQEVDEAKPLKAVLTKDKISYHEQKPIIREVSPSTSNSGSSTS